jgi:hypothetical protein
MKEDKRKAEAETRQVRAENRQVKAELKESNREKKLLIKMLKESGRSDAEIKSYLNSAVLANA